MTTFEFAFVVDGFDVADTDHTDALLTSCDGLEAYPGTDGQRTTISFVVAAAAGTPALIRAHQAFMDGPGVTGARVLGVDRDIVTISEIAERVDRNRESVRLMVTGARRDGRFPAHIGVVGKDMRLWYWADVWPWLRQHNLVAAEDLVPVAVETAKAFEQRLSIDPYIRA